MLENTPYRNFSNIATMANIRDCLPLCKHNVNQIEYNHGNTHGVPKTMALISVYTSQKPCLAAAIIYRSIVINIRIH